MEYSIWKAKNGPGPIIAVANHNGHALRAEVEEVMALDSESRVREEDPYTGEWAELAPTCLVAEHSRFEVDLNRPRETAVYLTPDDAWGLEVWKQSPSAAIINTSLAGYDAYYRMLEGLCREKQEQYGTFVVLDLHSYNHRRDGPNGPPADPEGNPEVNIGTGTMDHKRWGSLVEHFIDDLRGFDFFGRSLDVRENVKFVGRQFPRWVHTNFPETGCAIAVEFKKFFMDEWTGELDRRMHAAIGNAITGTFPGLELELEKVRSCNLIP
jgi:N-formylglutamate deformylase